MKTLFGPIVTLAVLGSLCSAVLFADHLIKTDPQKTSESENVKNAERIALWRSDIQLEGSEKAYQKLLTQEAGKLDSDQHLEAHLFGSALYSEKGIEGFSACGLELNAGCVHEFSGLAIHEYGVPIVKTLNEKCAEKFGTEHSTSCDHGIGHGLISYLGYTTKGLRQALDLCKKFDGADPLRGCYGGAFMEFRIRTMADNIPLPFDTDEPFSLCQEVKADYRSACYFWVPVWILRSLESEVERGAPSFAATGTYCEKAPAKFVDSCFQGLGYFAPPTAEYDHVQTKMLCDAVSAAQSHRDECWKTAVEVLH